MGNLLHLIPHTCNSFKDLLRRVRILNDRGIAAECSGFGIEARGMTIDKDPGFAFSVPGFLDDIGAGRVAVQSDDHRGAALEDLICETLVKAHSDGLNGNADADTALFETRNFFRCQMRRNHSEYFKSG